MKYTTKEIDLMLFALYDVIYKLENIYNSNDDREEILWHLNQLTKIENLLYNLKTTEINK